MKLSNFSALGCNIPNPKYKLSRSETLPVDPEDEYLLLAVATVYSEAYQCS